MVFFTSCVALTLILRVLVPSQAKSSLTKRPLQLLSSKVENNKCRAIFLKIFRYVNQLMFVCPPVVVPRLPCVVFSR